MGVLPGPSFRGSPLGYAPVDTASHSPTLGKSLRTGYTDDIMFGAESAAQLETRASR